MSTDQITANTTKGAKRIRPVIEPLMMAGVIIANMH